MKRTAYSDKRGETKNFTQYFSWIILWEEKHVNLRCRWKNNIKSEK